MRTSSLALVLGLALAGGCASAAANTKQDRAAAKEVTRALERHQSPGRNLEIHATLWTDALLPPETAGRKPQWVEPYLVDSTSFTVVLELANRPLGADPSKIDPRVDPSAWAFKLDRGQEHGLVPKDVKTIALDRYPTRAGGYHWRVVLAVHFAGKHDLAAATVGSPLTLHVVPRPVQEPRAASLGPALERKGVQLRWNPTKQKSLESANEPAVPANSQAAKR